KINRVELKNILPPREIQDAMEKQMKAEREKRQAILIAEGQKQASILTAEGEKESQILKAEGQNQATILRAEADKISRMKIAEGESTAIKMINEAHPSIEVLTLRGYDAFEKVASGQATKIIVPSNLQGLMTFATLFEEGKDKNKNTSTK
ncbi:MAG: SPFH domain-containing protein, partial [Fusobacteriaceae bacterium]